MLKHMQPRYRHLKFAHMAAPPGGACLLRACKSKRLHLITETGRHPSGLGQEAEIPPRCNGVTVRQPQQSGWPLSSTDVAVLRTGRFILQDGGALAYGTQPNIPRSALHILYVFFGILPKQL